MRRPFALLLAVLLLFQSGLVGSGVACLTGAAWAGAVGAHAAPPDGAGNHHGHHLAATGHRGAGGDAGDEREAAPNPHDLAHCLAAACATPALAVTLAELPVPASVAMQDEPAEPTAPFTPRVAPEPPPPRA